MSDHFSSSISAFGSDSRGKPEKQIDKSAVEPKAVGPKPGTSADDLIKTRIYRHRRLPEPVYFLTTLPLLARCWFYQTTVVAPFSLTMFLVYLSVKKSLGRGVSSDPELLLAAVPFIPVLIWSAYSCHMLLLEALQATRPRIANQAGMVAGLGGYSLLSAFMVFQAPQWITISVFAALVVFVQSFVLAGSYYFRGKRFSVQQIMVFIAIVSLGTVYMSTPERRLGSANLMSFLFLAVIACVPIVSLVNQVVMFRYVNAERRSKALCNRGLITILILAAIGLATSVGATVYLLYGFS